MAVLFWLRVLGPKGSNLTDQGKNGVPKGLPQNNGGHAAEGRSVMARRVASAVVGLGLIESVHVATAVAKERFVDVVGPSLFDAIELISQATLLLLALRLVWIVFPRLLIVLRWLLNVLLLAHEVLSSIARTCPQKIFDGICWLLKKIIVVLNATIEAIRQRSSVKQAPKKSAGPSGSNHRERPRKVPRFVKTIKERMKVLGSDGKYIGMVDQLEGADKIKLSKDGSKDGEHRFVPINLIDHVDDYIHLKKPAQDVMSEWQSV